MSKVKLEDILDESLDRIADGETVEECVAAYPEHAQALLPLLEAALALRQEVASAPFRPAAKARSLQRLLSAVEDRQPSRRRWLTFMRPASRPVGVALASLVGVTVASDPIEMPVVRVRFASTGEVSSIARRLERDERWLKTRLQAVADDMDSDMGQQVSQVRRLSDLRYRTVIAALDATHSSGTRLFWRNANAHLAQR